MFVIFHRIHSLSLSVSFRNKDDDWERRGSQNRAHRTWQKTLCSSSISPKTPTKPPSSCQHFLHTLLPSPFFYLALNESEFFRGDIILSFFLVFPQRIKDHQKGIHNTKFNCLCSKKINTVYTSHPPEEKICLLC